jgi:hypothetical protein
MRKKEQLLEIIKRELLNQSSFTAFKRWIIKENDDLRREFEQFIID